MNTPITAEDIIATVRQHYDCCDDEKIQETLVSLGASILGISDDKMLEELK